MIIVKMSDKRYIRGFSIKFFDTEDVTEEVIDYVKTHKKVYRIETNNIQWKTREAFLFAYNIEKPEQVKTYRKLVMLAIKEKIKSNAIQATEIDKVALQGIENNQMPAEVVRQLLMQAKVK